MFKRQRQRAGKTELLWPLLGDRTQDTPNWGEAAALKRWRDFRLTELPHYTDHRNFPALNATSHLSADLRSGALSIRRLWLDTLACKPDKNREVFLSELLWREFFSHVGFDFPEVYRKEFQTRFGKVRWRNSKKEFRAWCEGRTGFPIVDAGMRELTTTGFMQGRVRMITAMFLTKDLLVDWRWGEEFFRGHLVDADHTINNGNWQWCASTGCDAQPYFRVFNPWTQGKRFDPDATYIKRWVPELAELPPKVIHQPGAAHAQLRQGYPAPMVDHAEARIRCLTAFRKAD
jgi:deoxyribodipyrimidine photo-lyase